MNQIVGKESNLTHYFPQSKMPYNRGIDIAKSSTKSHGSIIFKNIDLCLKKLTIYNIIGAICLAIIH
jgi:hypothetical protein